MMYWPAFVVLYMMAEAALWNFLGRLSSRSNKSSYIVTTQNTHTGQAVKVTQARTNHCSHSHSHHCSHDHIHTHSDRHNANTNTDSRLPPMLRRPSTAWEEIIPPAPSTPASALVAPAAPIAVTTTPSPGQERSLDEVNAERQQQWDELERQSKKHWEEVGLLAAMLMSTPKLRVKTIDELKRSKCTLGDDCCPICLDDYDSDQLYRELPCGHVFHQDCVDSWLTKRVSCPVCKASVIDGCSELDRNAAKEMIRVNLARARRKISSTTVDKLPSGIKRSAPRPIPGRTPVRHIKTPVWSPSSAPDFNRRLLSAERSRRVSSI